MKSDFSPKGAAADLVVGWRNIGRAVGVNASTLTRAHSLGTLPVQPLKLGHMVAMSPMQVQSLKAALAKSGVRT